LGYVEGQNLVVERRYSEGRAERFPEFAAELVRLKADIIIVTTTPAALAVKSATKIVLVVFPTAIDPVGTGVVPSLARPAANITGLTTQAPEIVAKRLQLLKETIPHPEKCEARGTSSGSSPRWLESVPTRSCSSWMA
jgi:putative tryptophan/tyrosine transport system substrate-binding protein